jgi:predicted dehydrogenase
VGIIGYGFIGRVHAFCHRAIPFHFDPVPVETRLVAVATSRAETADAARRHGGFETGTHDWRRIIDNRDIQVVHICSPNAAHKEQLCAALAAGKHVYCDKPLTVTSAEASAVQEALRGWNGVGQMTFQNRFFSSSMRARQLIEEGFLGTPIGFRGAYLHAGSVDSSAPMRWRFRKAQGGGALRDLGSHLLDLLDWLAGPIAEIRADLRVLHDRRPDGKGGTEAVDAEDQALLTVRCAGGAVGTLEASKIATGTEDDLRLEIHGTRGALRLDIMQPDFLEAFSLSDPDAPIGGTRGWKRIATVQRFPAPAVFPSARATSGWLRGHTQCLYNFMSAVAEGSQAEPSLTQGVRVQRMIDCAERSAATGAWQRVER